MIRLLKFLRDAAAKRTALREYRAPALIDVEARQWTFHHTIKAALDLVESHQFARASAVWTETSTAYPEQCYQSELAITLLLKLKKYDQLEELMRMGMKKYPNRAMYLEGLANASFDQNKFAEAEGYAKQLRRRFPSEVVGYLLEAAALGAQNKADEAEQIIGTAITKWSDNAAVLLAHAKLAVRRGDQQAALERWDELYLKTKHPASVAGAITALAHLGRFEEADKRVEEQRYTFGSEHLMWISAARIAELKGDWEEAARRWAYYRGRFPKLPFGYTEGVQPLKRLQSHDEFEKVLAEGVDHVPDHLAIALEYARFAHERGAWNTAAMRWALVRKQFPSAHEGYQLGAEALDALGLFEQAHELRIQQKNSLNAKG